MSIAAFMAEAHKEDKYGYDFVSGIDNRVAVMNASQLRGLYEHLKKTARESNIDLWKNANLHIISRLEGLMREKEEVIVKERKKQEEEEAAERNKARMRKMRAQHNASALQVIERQARELAEKEVKEKESRRLVLERSEIMVKTIEADVQKERVWWRTAACYVVSLAGAIFVALKFLAALATVVIAVSVVLFTLLAAGVAYRYYAKTLIKPLVVTKADLESQVDAREVELREVAILEKRAKDKQYKEAVAAEKAQNKRRRALEAEKKRYEAELMEQRRKQQEAAFEEMSKSVTSMADLMSGALHSDSQSGSHSGPTTLTSAAALGFDVDLIGSKAASMDVSFASVRLSNMALSIDPKARWEARIELLGPAAADAEAAAAQEEKHDAGETTLRETSGAGQLESRCLLWSAACSLSTGTSILFTTDDRGGHSSCCLEAGTGQTVVVSIVAENDKGLDAAPLESDGKFALSSSSSPRSCPLLLGVFEAVEEDFFAATSPDAAAPLIDTEGSSAGAHCLRGVLLDKAYARVADISISFYCDVARKKDSFAGVPFHPFSEEPDDASESK